MNGLQTQTVIRIVSNKTESDKARALHIARITREVREGTYYVSGRHIAAKLIIRETVYCCST